MVRRSVLSAASAARRGMSLSAGITMVARMPMIEITTISSRRVNPEPCLPLPIGHPIQPHTLRQRIHVVYVLTPPGRRVRVVLVAALAPLVVAGHRVDGEPAQELHLAVHLSDQVDPLDQHLEVLGIAVRAQVDGDESGVAVALVLVDGVAHRAQRGAQLGLLEPLGGLLGDRERHGGEDAQDGAYHDEFRNRVATAPPPWPARAGRWRLSPP